MAPPIYVKGGAWTNVEDQILKAAVSKYGLTQWSRVASLLPQKTAKQAKARWNEYLNPTIDRSTWTRELDERLLSVAKLLPNQWRSIALVMGRPATQCVERYQALLEAAARSGDSPENSGHSDPADHPSDTADLGLAALGVESLPALGNAFESLASRPDAEDMADDEREMLSEAKARLANTQGKKAKRKDRERMLDESRRVALLQKRRELKAAGIAVGPAHNSRARTAGFDYNADIPHERRPRPGLHDVTGEDALNAAARAGFQRAVAQKGLPADAAKDTAAARRGATRAKASTRRAAEAVSGLDAAQHAKRRRLELPPPLPLAGPAPPRACGKQAARLLRGLLATMPPPREATRVVFPRLAGPGALLPEATGAHGEGPAAAQLALLRQVDDEKVRARRALAVRRGLPVPGADWEPLAAGAAGPCMDAIASECRALVQHDRAPGMGPGYVDDAMVARVEALVAGDVGDVGGRGAEGDGQGLPAENKDPAPLHSQAARPGPLPRLEHAITRVFELLHALDASANEADQRLAILEDTRAAAETRTALERQIADNARGLAEADLQERVLRRIQWDEEAAMDRRAAALSERVEDVKRAERRVARHEVM
ncbi:hypothetical protein METBIDRAFT_197206 [Metschnikowia bicuspidata var. bicuspidata NRRL YB-4993]|uniref:Pre-mRNA-splicing factor CEF1 n=1 Tax=Metschnikowia bicuspidata var. bicuspidata NRRL YB-4993 TaxID=869754 RepID=A0A1A0H8M5_9ASCO|nr:hypothetical protein METBIDRAFT_197206 [Metschnikowia bicuspidata var. bicuspidata NRRL YB-4993]OBA20366.1 hypothetical protein METBIDRAFT_197206 [Metschnikowia bicuspidata var. bicuspidata NRRL YB-4993]